jgi:[acyl-carrier-protein] S-malonyltransferase
MTDAVYFPFLVPARPEELEPVVRRSRHVAERIGQASDTLGRDVLAALSNPSGGGARRLGRDAWTAHAAVQMSVGLGLADRLDEVAPAAVSVCGGQCLGAWIAAVYSGALSWADALDIVRINGRIEADHFDSLPDPLGSMIVFLPNRRRASELLDDIDRGRPGGLELSLSFGRGLYGVAGPVRLLEPFGERVRAAGGRPVYRSNRVEHCSYTRVLQRRIAPVVRARRWRTPRVTVVSEVDGSLLDTAEDVRDDLIAGISAHVRWERTVAGLRAAAVRRAHVVGHNDKTMLGRVLADHFEVVPVAPGTAPAHDPAASRRHAG